VIYQSVPNQTHRIVGQKKSEHHSAVACDDLTFYLCHNVIFKTYHLP